MLRKALLTLFVLAIFVSGSVLAQNHTNFSGTWKLNLAKSNPGDYGPSQRTDVITQDGSKFTEKISSTTQMGQEDYTLSFTADGSKVTIAPDSPQATLGALTLKAIMASWNGEKLAVDTSASFQGQVDISGHNVYSLSPDGKTLTITNHASTSMGDFDTSLVFDKQ